jgi:hypothetical protein
VSLINQSINVTPVAMKLKKLMPAIMEPACLASALFTVFSHCRGADGKPAMLASF